MQLSGAIASAGFDALPMQVAILDEEGTIVYANRPWREFGADNGIQGDPDPVGVNYLRVCDVSENGDDAAAGIRDVIEGSRDVFTTEYPCHSPTEERWFTMRVNRFRHDGERYVLVLHLDITERKLAERRVRQEAEHLRNVARLLSHDLRNPLSVAVGYAEMLAADHPSDDRVDAVASALDRMDGIITDGLVLARYESVPTADERLVDLADAAERAWRTVDTEAATLVVAGDCSFYAEPDYLQHVFENLFRNSIEHGSASGDARSGDGDAERGDAVTVEVGPLDGGDGFYVEDDGPGVPPADRDGVFDAGFTTASGGTGFGLAIVERVVEAHGWRVRVTDAEGGGARFEIAGPELVE